MKISYTRPLSVTKIHPCSSHILFYEVDALVPFFKYKIKDIKKLDKFSEGNYFKHVITFSEHNYELENCIDYVAEHATENWNMSISLVEEDVMEWSSTFGFLQFTFYFQSMEDATSIKLALFN